VRFQTDAGGAILINSAEQFANQIERARELKPRVHVVCFGHYEVTKREAGAATYDVHLWLDGGQKKGKCSCAAGTPPMVEGQQKYAPMACYHLMSAIARHMQLAIELRAAATGQRDNLRQMPTAATLTGARGGQQQQHAQAA
jgi:hypothetical protein